MHRSRFRLIVGLLALFLSAQAAAGPSERPVDRLVTRLVDDHHRVVLPGNTRSEANPTNDRGAIADNQMLDHMQLLLRRPPARERELQDFMAGQNNPQSPYYHRWLTAAQFGDLFGPHQADVKIVAGWLRQHGAIINAVQPNRMVIDFSATARTVRHLFNTEIHHLSVGGVAHIANMRDPQIPEALGGIIRGVVSLHDFRPHPQRTPRPQYDFTSGTTTTEAVVPTDLATIYNINPLFAAGISGQGQTVAVIEDTDINNTIDWITFRVAFGLAGYNTAWLVETHPDSPGQSCTDPGVVPDNQSEATLDTEWASAAAPSAKIDLVSCADTNTTFGVLIALQNLLDAGNAPAIISISYGQCEAENGAAGNAAFSAAYQQAASMGVSVFVSTGDDGAASCDDGATAATDGIGVSGLATTPYNVAVGGTDFGDSFARTNSRYWNATNDANQGSAKSYIPEIAWDNSCANGLLTQFSGFTTSYGSTGFCNSTRAATKFLNVVAGGGGASACATGVPAVDSVVGGTCQGTPKPAWQSLVGNPSDGVRDVPDIALFAANGIWGHYYVYCDSDVADGGIDCSGAPSTWSGAGGTSFAAPIMAGIQALINQTHGGAQGNPDPVLYALARADYGNAGNPACNSSTTAAAPSGCVFHDVTSGDIAVNCTGPVDCYDPSGANGVLSTSSVIGNPAFGTGTGWDFATGIGSIDATNLVDRWNVGLALATPALTPLD